jgi:hypothetical protein
MYEVFTKDDYSLGNFQTLDSAMKLAKAQGEFVVIKSDTMEIAGKFGVDSPPDNYEWKKEYSIGRRKKEWKRDETKEDR